MKTSKRQGSKRLRKLDRRFAQDARIQRMAMADRPYHLSANLPQLWLRDDIEEHMQALEDPITFACSEARRVVQELADSDPAEIREYLDGVENPVKKELIYRAALALQELQAHVSKQKRRELKAILKAEKGGKSDAS